MEKNLVCKLVKAMELQKGEVVLLNFWGEDTEIQDLYDFVGAVAAETLKALMLEIINKPANNNVKILVVFFIIVLFSLFIKNVFWF